MLTSLGQKTGSNRTLRSLRPASRLPAALACAALVVSGALPSACDARADDAIPGADTRVLLIGVDGLSWTVLARMMEAGELPTIARLVEEGALCPRFDVVSPHSPLAWTSIATSRSPAGHGIVDYTTQLPNGTRVPVTGSQRRARALWEVASEHGVSVGVVGWWATWPAERVEGYVVSDHANPALAELWIEDGRYWTADAEVLKSLDQDVFPPDIAPTVARAAITPRNFSYQEFQRRARLTPAQLELVKREPWYKREYYSHLKSFYAMDYSTVAAARVLIPERPTRLVMVYLRGPDPVQHKAWDLVEPEKYQVKPPHLERDRGVVEAVYRYVDIFLEELIVAVGPRAWILVASDHGAEPSPEATGIPRRGRPGAHTHTAKGVLFLHGPEVRRSHRIAEASPYDIMPTILWLLDIPIARDLEGQVLKEAFRDPFVNSKEPVFVESYGTRPTRPALPSSVDEVMLEGLRNLGYIE
jgi:arylsulfatase A-like enzyme